jgi:hypothetical protein
LVFVFEFAGGVEAEPVVSVEDGWGAFGAPAFEELAATEVGGLVEKLDFVNEVLGFAFEVDTVNVDAARLDLLVGGFGGRFCDDVDFNTALDKGGGEFVNVGADATHEARRVFP